MSRTKPYPDCLACRGKGGRYFERTIYPFDAAPGDDESRYPVEEYWVPCSHCEQRRKEEKELAELEAYEHRVINGPPPPMRMPGSEGLRADDY